uniref:Transmembrane protein n=1 Tax=Poecilia mexicana TaxID=48701 RepID=A0A3B3Z0D1_9TELE
MNPQCYTVAMDLGVCQLRNFSISFLSSVLGKESATVTVDNSSSGASVVAIDNKIEQAMVSWRLCLHESYVTPSVMQRCCHWILSCLRFSVLVFFWGASVLLIFSACFCTCLFGLFLVWSSVWARLEAPSCFSRTALLSSSVARQASLPSMLYK